MTAKRSVASTARLVSTPKAIMILPASATCITSNGVLAAMFWKLRMAISASWAPPANASICRFRLCISAPVLKVLTRARPIASIPLVARFAATPALKRLPSMFCVLLPLGMSDGFGRLFLSSLAAPASLFISSAVSLVFFAKRSTSLRAAFFSLTVPFSARVTLSCSLAESLRLRSISFWFFSTSFCAPIVS